MSQSACSYNRLNVELGVCSCSEHEQKRDKSKRQRRTLIGHSPFLLLSGSAGFGLSKQSSVLHGECDKYSLNLHCRLQSERGDLKVVSRAKPGGFTRLSVTEGAHS
jgi:hypothetical protein